MAYKNKADATAYQNKFIAKAYDRVNLTLPKGQKEVVQSHAAALGESVNGFIGRAISETMERDSGGTAPETTGKGQKSTQGAGVVSLPPETLEAAQRAAEAAGQTMSDFVRRAVEQCIPREIKVITVSETATPKFVKVTIKEA